MAGESWWQTSRRLDDEARGLNLAERLTIAAGGVLGASPVYLVLWNRELFPSRSWWAAALAAAMLLLFAVLPYLYLAMIARSKRRRRRERRRHRREQPPGS